MTETGPLITLAAADSLEYLLYPDAPVHVSDAVLYEATIKSDALGAQSIAAWVQQHTDALRGQEQRSPSRGPAARWG